jgi:cell division protein FtsN
MRWFFLILLMVNILYLAWELKRERPVPAVSATLPQHVDRIMLLSELETEAPQPEPEPEPVVQAAAELAEQSPTLSEAQAVEQQQQVDTTEAEPDTVATATDSQPGTAETLDDTDTPVADRAVAGAKLDPPLEIPADRPADDLCFTLGPFREMKTLRIVTREIKDYVVEASFRSREEQEQSMFRVYLAPVGSNREAKALIKQLVSKNIRDYFIIADGPKKNGVSLGYFSNKGRAQRHAERVRQSGFDAIIEPVFRSYTIYWLDYRIKAGNKIPQRIFDQHLNNTTQRLSRSCVSN